MLIPASQRNTGVHSLHPYPAKFPPAIAGDILARFVRPGETVLDPFCGSGTTLVEARLRGINAIGVDINELACLVSQVKTTPLTENDFVQIQRILFRVENAINSQRVISTAPIEFSGREHWFQCNVAHEISFILSVIADCKSATIQNFLHITLSSILVRVSNQESDTRYAAIEKNVGDKVTLRLFRQKAMDNAKHLRLLSTQCDKQVKVTVYDADSRYLPFLDTESVHCVVTSPPYANTYDYYLYHKFRCLWLGLDFRRAQNGEIGSRREFSSLKRSPEKWREDLHACLKEIQRILLPRASAFLIIGDSIINGNLLESDKLVSSIAHETGFKVRDIESSCQSKHSRSFNPSFARKGKREHFIHLEKHA